MLDKDIGILVGSIYTSVNALRSMSVVYSDILVLTGVGYRVELIEPNILRFDVGYSHYVKMRVPVGINVVVDNTGIRRTLTSSNKQLRGDTLYKISHVRKRNPYTGAGIVIISEIDSLRKLKSTKSDKTK
jgi:ribosomal protein L6P/L9E